MNAQLSIDLDALLGDPPETKRAAEAGTSNGSKKISKADQQDYTKAKPATLDLLLGNPSPNLRAALAHAEAGRPVFPCSQDKRPLVRWRDAATTDRALICEWWRKWPEAMPGLPTGEASGLAVLDLDLRQGKDGETALRDLGIDATSPVTIATPSGGKHIYFQWPEGLTNSAGKIAPGVDVRAEGGYVIAPGAVNGVGAYGAADPQPAALPEWPSELSAPRTSAPLFDPDPEDDLLVDAAESKRAREWADQARIRAALDVIPAESYDDWTQIGMALYHASAGAEDGLALWKDWSAKSPKAATLRPREWASKWRSFATRGKAVTIASLFHLAKAHGWNPAAPSPGSSDALAALLGESKSTAETSGLTFLSPGDCATSNPRPYIVKGLIASGDVACIVGAPGAGKSVIAPALAYAVAQGREAHWKRTKAGGVMYVAAEDEHGMQGRVHALLKEHGDAENFILVRGVTDLFNEDVAGQGSRDFNALHAAVKERKPALIVIDTLAAAFPGLEENSAEAMGRVVASARALTKWGAAVILLHHDTKDGMQGLPRGHSLLNGALDLSIHLRKDEDGLVRARLTKNRNGPCDLDLAFKIDSVEIGRDEDGDTVTAPVCVPMNPGAIGSAGARLKPSEKAALESIREVMGDGDCVDESEWRVIAKGDARISASENPDNRRRVISSALAGLCRKGVIEVEGEVIRLPDGIDWDEPDQTEEDAE